MNTPTPAQTATSAEAAEQLLARAQQALRAPAGQVPSPCMKVCRMDATTQLCKGCWRTMREIVSWQNLDDDAQRQVWRDTAQRCQAA